MSLTSAQLATVKADILANSDLSSQLNNGDGNSNIAALYNALASPSFFVFRDNVPVSELFDQITWANYTPQDAVPTDTVLNVTIWQARADVCRNKQANLQMMLLSPMAFNAGHIVLRTGMNDATTNLPSGAAGANKSGGWAGILVILRRQATRIEKLFATQTSGVGVVGTDALGATTNPGLIGFSGTISSLDIDQARNS